MIQTSIEIKINAVLKYCWDHSSVWFLHNITLFHLCVIFYVNFPGHLSFHVIVSSLVYLFSFFFLIFLCLCFDVLSNHVHPFILFRQHPCFLQLFYILYFSLFIGNFFDFSFSFIDLIALLTLFNLFSIYLSSSWLLIIVYLKFSNLFSQSCIFLRPFRI